MDARFTVDEYDEMLGEVRNYLPAFLSPAATEHHDPAGDVRELLRLRTTDLDRLVAVHVSLSTEVVGFVAALDNGLRRPLASTERPEEATQALRGPIDWGATTRRRSLNGFDRSSFVVRPAQRLFDTPENRALAWTVAQLHGMLGQASASLMDADPDSEAAGWIARLQRMTAALRRANRVEWLRAVPPARPTPRDQGRLQASRLRFYRHDLHGAVRAVLDSERRDEDALTDILCHRYFRPDKAWRLFEVLVALRLSREFAKPEYAASPRRTRLLAGAGSVGAFASYKLADGGSVALTYQGWPASPFKSERWLAGQRHGFSPQGSIPDLFMLRTAADGEVVDAVVLELKATKRPGYLGQGLFELLGYLGERPELFTRRPAGWLVAPPSSAFVAADADGQSPLWIVDAVEVAAQAAARMTRPLEELET